MGRLLPDGEKGNNFFDSVSHLNAKESTLDIPIQGQLFHLDETRRVAPQHALFFHSSEILSFLW
jgi:hypothetical protein